MATSASPTRLASARATLAALGHNLGRPGLAAAAELPGLLAAVDQHAAALRDRLGDGHRRPTLIGLAGYTQGLFDAATELGWRPPPNHAIDWTRPHWLLLRLLAAYHLAEAAGYA